MNYSMSVIVMTLSSFLKGFKAPDQLISLDMWEITGHGRKRTRGKNTSLEITLELQLDVNPIIVQYQTTANF